MRVISSYQSLANAIIAQAAEDYLDLCAGFFADSPPICSQRRKALKGFSIPNGTPF